MKRVYLFVSAAVIVFAMGCSSGVAPTAPSHAAVGSQAGIISVSPSSAPALFGASVVDFARCLQTAAAPGCFTAPRVTPRQVSRRAR